MEGSAPAPSAPSTIATNASPAASPGAGAPPPAGAPAAPQTGAGAKPLAAKPGVTPTAAEQAAAERYVYKRLRDGADPEEIDISDFRHRVKVNGVEKEVGIDDLVRDYRTRAASFQKFEEAAKLRQQVDANRQKLEAAAKALKDPARVMDHLRSLLGEKFDSFLEERMVERIHREKLPPAVRQQLEAADQRERELRTREQRIAEQEAAVQRQTEERRRSAAREQAERWRREWPQAFAAMGLPASETVMGRAVEMTRAELQRMARAGMPIDEVAIRDAQRATVEFMREIVGQTVRSTAPEQLRSLAGDEALEAAARARAAAVEAQPGRSAPTSNNDPVTGRFTAKPGKRVDLMELARGIGQR